MSIYGSDLVLTTQTVIYDPQNGPELEQVWRGYRPSVLNLAAVFKAAGYRCRVTDDSSGASTLLVTIPQNDGTGTPETPTDKFIIATEYVQESVWGSEYVTKTIKTIATTYSYASTEEALAAAKGPVDAALKGRTAIAFGPINPASLPLTYTQIREGPLLPSECNFSLYFATAQPLMVGMMDKIYAQGVRGTTAVSVQHPVLKWVRNYSVAYAPRRQIPAYPSIYTTEALVRDFLIPATVAAQLPSDPTWDITDTEWSWLEQAHDVEIDWYGKVTDTTEFKFAAWSTFFYSLVS